jgi:hypothetical protein
MDSSHVAYPNGKRTRRGLVDRGTVKVACNVDPAN